MCFWWGEAGGATPIGPASYHIAQLAVGGVIVGVDAVLQGGVDNVYVLCRPPGHHAERELATGFCLLANGAIGVRYACKKYGLKRIAVVDYDVHHGNGCETLFYSDPDTLTISIHQNNLFPPSEAQLLKLAPVVGKELTLTFLCLQVLVVKHIGRLLSILFYPLFTDFNLK